MGSDAVVHTGMGAIPHGGGVAFRVWAPHASEVFVKGSFNDWADPGHPMTSEANGYWYADVENVQPGDEYKYLIVNGEQRLERIDPYARQVTNSVGNGVVHRTDFDWQGDDYTLPPHNDLVIYELHVGSFFAPDGSSPGGFDAVVDKLGHLKRLGVNVIQIMPVAEFAGDYSWGYNPAHIFAVESAYGGPEALKTLVREAHRQGLGVILDVVYNHFGPSDLNLWQFDGWQENGLGGIYFYNDWRAETPWGATRPDYGRDEVRQFIRDNAMMWLDDYHVDGLRYDMTLYMRSVRGDGSDDLPEGWSLAQWINGETRDRFPDRILIAEDLRNNEWLTKSPLEGGAGFHAQWDANFVHPIREAVIVSEDHQRSMAAVCDAIAFRYVDDAFRRVVYSESHDEVANGKARVPQEVNPEDPQGWYAQKRSTLAAGLVFTSPGIPMLFQGQEFLQGEWFRDDVPLDWDLREDYRGIVRMYRDLIYLRRGGSHQAQGLRGQFLNIYHVNESDNVLAFQRWDQHGAGDDVVVIVNLSSEAKHNYNLGMPVEGTWQLLFNSDADIYSETFGNHPAADLMAQSGSLDGMDAHAIVSIGSYSLLIYTLAG